MERKDDTTLILTDENEYEVELGEWARGVDAPGVPWVTRQLSAHGFPPGRPSMIVLGGARAVFPAVRVAEDSLLWLCFGAGLPEISSDGLDVFVEFRAEGGGPVTRLLEEHVPRFDAEDPWREETLDLASLAGRRGQLIVGCDPGPEQDNRGDWLALYELVVSSAPTLTLNRARAYPAYRAANELAVFSASYDHPLYGRSLPGSLRNLLRTAKGRVGRLVHALDRDRLADGWSRTRERVRRLFAEKPAPAAPPVTEAADEEGSPTGIESNLQVYYPAELLRRLELKTIDFRGRLVSRLGTSGEAPIRILSLASGAARVEESIVDGLDPGRIELTLTDLNPELLKTASERLTDKAIVDCRVLNLNELELPERSFDVVLCVSALHHVVELERLTERVAGSLAEGGELWIIGEYIGRNGSRLQDDAYEVANELFRGLPERYRVDRNPGSTGRIDRTLPNLDCSISCFEGIRSEEIESVLESRFEAVERLRFDCFTWRLFNLAYLDNYDLGRQADLDVVERALDLEVGFQRAGGRPTALWGVYRRR